MLLTKIHCDGCLRLPNLWEWMKGELTNDGYPDWRYPGIPFREAGVSLGDSGTRGAELFHRLFGRPLPEEPGYLCPQCQVRVLNELPALAAEVDDRTQAMPPPGAYFGR
jgi:hypothetical protein